MYPFSENNYNQQTKLEFDMLFYANFSPFQKRWFNIETSISLSISRGKESVIYQNLS